MRKGESGNYRKRHFCEGNLFQILYLPCPSQRQFK